MITIRFPNQKMTSIGSLFKLPSQISQHKQTQRILKSLKNSLFPKQTKNRKKKPNINNNDNKAQTNPRPYVLLYFPGLPLSCLALRIPGVWAPVGEGPAVLPQVEAVHLP